MDKEVVGKSIAASWALTAAVYVAGECIRCGISEAGGAVVRYLWGSLVALLGLFVAARISQYLESAKDGF